MVVKGLKASKQLLTGAEEISTHGKTRHFQKFGDVRDAFQDLMAVNIGGVRNFRSRDGVIVLLLQLSIVALEEKSKQLPGNAAIRTKILSSKPKYR